VEVLLDELAILRKAFPAASVYRWYTGEIHIDFGPAGTVAVWLDESGCWRCRDFSTNSIPSLIERVYTVLRKKEHARHAEVLEHLQEPPYLPTWKVEPLDAPGAYRFRVSREDTAVVLRKNDDGLWHAEHPTQGHILTPTFSRAYLALVWALQELQANTVKFQEFWRKEIEGFQAKLSNSEDFLVRYAKYLEELEDGHG